MKKRRVLFICTRNSARSQMAEAWLNAIGGEAFEAASAGLEPGTIKPLGVEAMLEVGIDLSRKGTQTLADLAKAGRPFDYVIALCSPAKAAGCPALPGDGKRLHWDVPERSKAMQSREEQLAHVRSVRDLLQEKVKAWVAENRDA